MQSKIRQKLPHLLVIRGERCPKIRKAILHNCDNTLVSVLSNCVLNAIANPSIKLTPHCLKKIRPYKNVIREFANPKVSLKEKRRILKKPQVGGWIVPILTTLLGSAIPALIDSFTKK